MRRTETAGILLGILWLTWPGAGIASQPGEVRATTPVQRVEALWQIADAHRAAGRTPAALEALEAAWREPAGDRHAALTAVRRADAELALARFDAAHSSLEFANGLAASLSPPDRALLLIERGRLAAEQGDLTTALAHFGDAASLVGDAAPVSRATAESNALRARLERRDLDLEAPLAALHRHLLDLPEGDHQARLLIGFGEICQRAVRELAYPPGLLRTATDAYRQALAIPSATVPTRAWAYGFLGSAYLDAGRPDEARTLSRYALLLAQEAHADEQVYRWEWQLGRILRAGGEAAQAEAAYGRAVEVLDRVKPNFPLGARDTFTTLVAPVYTGYADLRLARTAGMQAGPAKADELRAVRELLETLKHAEVEDYFASECLVTGDGTGGAAREPDTAVIYPVLLDARTELLVEVGDEIHQVTVPVGRREVDATIRAFRRNLERVTAGTAYRAQARQLYDWMFEPIAGLLAEHAVTTLVMVPDGALRTVPVAAFHDGERFLIERYAIATTPAMRLVQPARAAGAANLLAGGITTSVQGFSSLPAVGRELDEVSSVFGGTAIRDESFSLATLRAELANDQYSMAHFATHGKFEADYRDSFLLTYDSRLTLLDMRDALARRTDEPLELLVLSACETAAGNDRAALGLAGIAIQSGARSAVASLWRISDAATAELVPDFYRELRAAPGNKAERLQSAQLNLIRKTRFDHPSFWAPFLLIGDWR